MSLKLSLESEIRKLDLFLDKAKTKALEKAVRNSLNRTLKTLNKEVSKIIRKQRAIKAGDLKKKQFVTMRKAKGHLGQLEAVLTVSGKPIPLVQFVSGSKTPKSQKGVPIRRRKKLKVRIQPGKASKREHAFLARAKRGPSSFQVFRRKKKDKGPIAIQTIPGLSTLFRGNEPILEKLNQLSQRRMNTEFQRQFAFQLSKLK